METKILHRQFAEPVDDETKAALEESIAQADRGETVSLEQSTLNLRKRIEAWRKSQEHIAEQ